VQQAHESEQHYILHGDTAKGTEKYRAGKLKRVSGQYQTYSKDGHTGSRRTNQLKAGNYHSR